MESKNFLLYKQGERHSNVLLNCIKFCIYTYFIQYSIYLYLCNLCFCFYTQKNLVHETDRRISRIKSNSLGSVSNLVCRRSRCLSWTGQAWMYDEREKKLSIPSGISYLSDLSGASSMPLCSWIVTAGM